MPEGPDPRPAPDPRRAEVAAPRLAILSFSSGEYDARSFRIARSASAAGYEVTIYSRWWPGLALTEERDGYTLVRVPFTGWQGVPGLRGIARRRLARQVAAGGVASASEPVSAPPAPAPARHPSLRAWGTIRRWYRVLLMFPMRPLGWAEALDDVALPADVWHGMWAGSLPALRRLKRRHGGRTIYDSRDVYLHSRDFATLEWPFRPILARLERLWAADVDRIVTVNEPYAGLIAAQLGVPRPTVILNCPEVWTPPSPPPDRLREAAGIGADTRVVLYQGQLISDRGIEQLVEAIREVPGAALCLLGYGGMADGLRVLASKAPHRGRVFVLPSVPPRDLLEWTASADVMAMPIQPTTPNHRFTTPQKLWEAIAAGVPVVASDLPGMADVVVPAEVGELCDATDPASIAAAIRRVLDRPPEAVAALRAQVLAQAHARYNWESQLDTLFGLYAELGQPPQRPPAGLAPGPRIRFSPGYTPAGAGAARGAEAAGTIQVVLDTTWTPTVDEAATGPILLRDVVEDILRERDLIAEAATALDGWVEASGIVSLLVHEGVSFWYGIRLRYWSWLLDQLLWLAVVERLVGDHPAARVLAFDEGADELLVAAARAVAKRDGLTVEGGQAADGGHGPEGEARPPAAGAAGAAGRRLSSGSAWARRGRAVVARVRGRLAPTEAQRRDRRLTARLAELRRSPERRLLVVSAHAPQRIETASGARSMNVYLTPVADRLAGSRLEPLEIGIRPGATGDRPAQAPGSAGGGGSVTAGAPPAGEPIAGALPADVLRLAAPQVREAAGRLAAAGVATRVAAITTPLRVSGIDLGPALSERIARWIAGTHGRRIADVARIRALLRQVHPAGILIADEYHRQDWLAAAGAESVPVAAIQHGVIYRWHTGYVHRSRPAELRLPGRTYVFGTWERDLLTGASVYTPDEVVVGGSPRLDLVSPEAVNRDAVRSELGVADGDRLVVLSGTWGTLYRRFHYPIALAHLLAGPLERVHLVVKLHPSERDEGPYRRIVEGLARAGGFAPPPITVVRDVDLYRLLAAADAHLGIHSTLLTEAVATGTPNLLAVGLHSADLLGYVEAGVAIPVATSADLMAALDVPRGEAMDPGRRRAFLDAHFEPGSASDRIAEDLLRWLS